MTKVRVGDDVELFCLVQNHNDGLKKAEHRLKLDLYKSHSGEFWKNTCISNADTNVQQCATTSTHGQEAETGLPSNHEGQIITTRPVLLDAKQKVFFYLLFSAFAH